MMLRHGTLPPFIHPRLISSHAENTRMEPLTNCVSLMHMIGSRIQGSRKLFWKNVRLECERLCAEVCLFGFRTLKDNQKIIIAKDSLC